MKRLLRKLIVSCVYEGVQLYIRRHRFALLGTIELRPMTTQQFEEHLNRVFHGDESYVKAYLDANDPMTE